MNVTFSCMILTIAILIKSNYTAMINAFVKSILSFIMMEGMIMGISAKDFQQNAGAFGAVILAFMLRIAMDSKKSRQTVTGVFRQMVITVALCFISVYIWRDFLDYKKGFEIYLFTVSLSSVFISGQLDRMIENGFKNWAKNFIGKVMAKNETEDHV